MKDLKELLIETIKEAGKLSLQYFRNEVEHESKGGLDIVTVADKAVEKFIRSKLEATGYNLLGEEQGLEDKGSDHTWIIDPIDGTRNFARGFPFFNNTIALSKNGEVIMGVIYDPVHDELFFAKKGEGAYLNDKKIGVKDEVPHATIISCSVGFAKQIRKDLSLQTRVFGSAALELAYVACGRIQGCTLRNLKQWDFAAGALLVEEAGGIVTDITNDQFNLDDNSILASTKKLHKRMYEYFNKA